MKPQIEHLPLDALVPYARNSRTHSPEQIAQVAASIREFGFTNPVLIDGEGGIIAGHGRVMAARQLGLSEVPCIRLAHLTGAQKRAYVIADNKLALNAGWDDALLALELRDLGSEGFALHLTGFSDEELDNLLDIDGVGEEKRDPDDAPAIPRTPATKTGDTWLLGAHRVRCGDSTSAADWESLMLGEKADIVWTDPPYNVAYESENAGAIQNDNMSDADFRAFLRSAFSALCSVMKPGAAIYVAHADTEGLNFRAAYREAGLKLSGCLVWRKDSLVLGRSDYQWQHEPILYGWKPGAAHRWFGGRKQTTIHDLGEDSPFEKMPDGRWVVRIADQALIITGDAKVEESPLSIIYAEKPKRSAEHPTMKPVALVERMLRNNARPGDIAADAFGGSGSTLIAAERLRMRARLMELDPKFVDVIVRRWQDFTGQRATHAETGEPFPEAPRA